MTDLRERFRSGLRKNPFAGALLRHLEVTRTDCVLDVGANLGQYARMLRGRGFRGEILSFEPVRSTFEALERSARRDPRWRVFPFALGREAGTLDIMRHTRSDFSSALPVNAAGTAQFPGLDRPETETVQVRRLDELLPTLLAGREEPKIFLKSDTQGYDLEVLAGLGAFVPGLTGIQMEVAVNPIYEGAPDIAETLQTLRQAGFSPVGFRPISWNQGVLAEMDGLFRNDAAAEHG